MKFWGFLPREEVLEKLSLCPVLVHPSLHDSGRCVYVEAMAANDRPVICLNLGGVTYKLLIKLALELRLIILNRSLGHSGCHD